ncbi:MAG: serine/threonine-protein kinase [Planctomycetota bacterium]|jgi:serine/threonine-protein kinase
MPTKNDRELGTLLVDMNFAEQSVVDEALAKQKELEKEGALVTLDRVMVENNWLTPVQVELALESQNRKIVYCTGCTSKYNVFTKPGGTTVTCRKCKASIPVPVRLLDREILDEATEVTSGPIEVPDDQDDELIGKMLGGYRVEALISKGGMGIVYQAHQVSLDRKVDLKVLPPALARDEAYVKRFLHEAKAAGRLQHANIIQVYDIGEANGVYYFSMEHVEGESLAELLVKKSPLTVETAVRIGLQICKALTQAHKADLVHRDVRPNTIMITEEGVAKLAELGFTKALDEAAVVGAGGGGLESPFYLAPEQITDSKAVGPAADLYSLGATIFRMVTGVRPFEKNNLMGVFKAVLNEPPPSPKEVRSDVPEDLADLVMHAMQKDPATRFASAQQMLGALRGLELRTDSGRIPREERGGLSDRFRRFTKRLRRKK